MWTAITTSEGPAADSLRTRIWNGFIRTPASRAGAFWTSMAFLVLAAGGVVIDQLSGRSVSGTAPLAAVMMVAFGLGDLSRRTRHVVVSRVVAVIIGLAIFAIWATVGV
ncbi:MAG: hypothetical protein JJT89_12990 [Nitriliruptoraceae bacterium]|nr:hypothetical protein [Nitriliruptoraceae bacterium]